MPNPGGGHRVLYVTKNDGTDTRMSKECNSLARRGYQVVFLGWDRSPDSEKSSPIPDIEKRILVYKAPYRSMLLLISFWRYYFYLIGELRKIRPDVVHAVNEDITLLLVILKPFFRYKIVCDIYDSFSLRYASKNRLVSSVASFLCKVAWRFSDAVLVTDKDRQARLGVSEDKCWVVSNYPEDPAGLNSSSIDRIDGQFYLYVAGTLYRSRGLDQLLEVLDQLENVNVICAGWLYDDLAKAFIEHPKVSYIGVLTPQESLAQAAACDLSVALYEPVDENMLLASPNKIYDSMSVGRPVLINSEAKVSAWVVSNDLGYSCAYSDVDSMVRIIASIDQDRDRQMSKNMKIREFFESGYSWAVAEKEMFSAYSSIVSG